MSHPDRELQIELCGNSVTSSGGLATLYLDCPQDKKIEICQGAMVTLVPSSFKEPFGLVAIESLAMGTPVLVYSARVLQAFLLEWRRYVHFLYTESSSSHPVHIAPILFEEFIISLSAPSLYARTWFPSQDFL